MSTRQELILKRLTEEGQKTVAYFSGLAPAALEQQVYLTGPTWRVHDILAHFVSAEQILKFYGLQILGGGSGAPADFVIDEFNAIEVSGLRGATAGDLAQRFAQARAATVDLVRGMAEADLDRVGRHPWFGNVPLEQMLKLVYRHNMLHERDVRKALETGQPAPHNNAQPVAQ